MIRRLARWTGVITLALAWIVAPCWFVGRVLTDRYLWSQFLWWMPTPHTLVVVSCLLGFSWALQRSSRSDRKRAGMAPAGRLGVDHLALRVGWVAALVMLATWLVVEVRVHRVVLGRSVPVVAKSMRFAAWNVSVTRLPDLDQRVRVMRPDVMLLSNAPPFTPITPTREAMGSGASVAAVGRLTLLSRYPVLTYAWVKLDVTGARPKTLRWKEGSVTLTDRGEALLVLLDTRGWNGSETCVWLLDLPSDPLVPRERMMREVHDAISRFTGPVYRRAANGLDLPVPAPESTLARLRTPDIIAGDMNTPRGSRSLRWLGSGMRHAAYDAGWGWRRTWPRSSPMWAIDNMLIAPSVRATSYAPHDAGGHQHLAQVAEFVPVEHQK
jgi:hypothetical protein